MTSELTEEDLEALRPLDGMYVGSLNHEEQALISRAVAQGVASRKYFGAAGFMGLSKVAINWEQFSAASARFT